MTQKTIITRKYHDGKLYDDIEKKVYEVDAPVYNLIRHTKQSFLDGNFPEVFYTVTCTYTDGSIQVFHFEELKTAFRVFRNLVGFIPISL